MGLPTDIAKRVLQIPEEERRIAFMRRLARANPTMDRKVRTALTRIKNAANR